MKIRFLPLSILILLALLVPFSLVFGDDALVPAPTIQAEPTSAAPEVVATDRFELTSSAFSNEGVIPDKYTCKGADFSPPFTIRNIPKGTQSLALTIHDPEGLIGTWVHWVVFNLPADLNEIPERSNLGVQALNDFGNFYYGGPCLADQKEHRFVFALYALNTVLKDVNEGATKDTLDQAMRSKIIGKAILIGTYQNTNWK